MHDNPHANYDMKKLTKTGKAMANVPIPYVFCIKHAFCIQQNTFPTYFVSNKTYTPLRSDTVRLKS